MHLVKNFVTRTGRRSWNVRTDRRSLQSIPEGTLLSGVRVTLTTLLDIRPKSSGSPDSVRQLVGFLNVNLGRSPCFLQTYILGPLFSSLKRIDRTEDMASPKKTIVVVGATGNQGSSVVHTFLVLPEWCVRCLTRKPSSSPAQALSALGAEIIEGDLTDPFSVERAFDSCQAILPTLTFGQPTAIPVLPGKPELPASRSVNTLLM